MLSVETLLVLGGLAVSCIAILAGLAAWVSVQWLKLRARQLEATPASPAPPQSPSSPSLHRIDLADLRERVRKLEAIASGVDF